MIFVYRYKNKPSYLFYMACVPEQDSKAHLQKAVCVEWFYVLLAQSSLLLSFCLFDTNFMVFFPSATQQRRPCQGVGTHDASTCN